VLLSFVEEMLSSRLVLKSGNVALRAMSTTVSLASSNPTSSTANYVFLVGSSARKIAHLKMEHAETDKKGGKGSVQNLNEEDVNVEDAAILNYTPEEHQLNRIARIYRPSKNAMQSGHFNTKRWKVEFDTQERWENATMGWGSSADPLANISAALSFKTKEQAVEFMEKQGFRCYVDENPPKKMQPKEYGINFSWNKRVRRGMK